jgi:predicted ATPase
LVSISLDQNDAEAAIPFARRWLSLDPLNEAAHRQLMLAFDRAGQHSAALRQYQECARILQVELGAVPDPETTKLYEQIKSDSAKPKAAAARRHNLPQTSTPFIGRVDELAQIATLLSDPDCRLLTLVGSGGVGKTRIALQAAQAQLREFADGVFFVALAPIGEPASIVSAIADAIGFSFFSQSAGENQSMQLRQLLNYLSRKQMLLVLDNFEHLLPASSLLTDILRAAPRVRLLVTSRERLNVTDEWALLIEGMRVPATDSQEDAEGYSAVQLFVQNARRVVVGFALTEAERPFVVRICQLVEGLPLGLELAAAWIKTLTCREIAQEIERSLDFLTTPLRDVPERHQSLRAVFAYSWNLLTASEQEVFRRLSVFRGGCDRDAAFAVTGATLPILTALVDKSLLYHRDNSRYEMHELVRQFAAEKLDLVTNDRAQTLARHCTHYADFMRARLSRLHGPEQKKASEQIGAEIENIRAGWQWALSHYEAAALSHYLEGVAWFFDNRCRFQDADDLFSQTLSTFEQKDERSLEETVFVGQLLAWHGHFCDRLGRYLPGRDNIQKSLSLLRPLAARAQDALVLANTVAVAWWGIVTDPAEVESMVQANLAYYRARSEHWGIARMLFLSALHKYRQGHQIEAKRLCREALQMQREKGDTALAARDFNALGEVLHHHGEYSEARQCYQESLELARELENRYEMSIGLDCSGYVDRRMGDFATARRQHEESLALSREIGDQLGVAGSLDNLGLIAYDQGDYAEAERLFREGLVLRRTTESTWSIAISLTHLAGVALARGDLAQAEQFLEDSLTHNPDWTDTLIRLGDLRRAQGRLPEAQDHYRQALQSGQRWREPPLALEVVVEVAALQVQAGQAAQAAELAIFVLNHPASDYVTRTKADRLCDGISKQLSAERLAAAEVRAQSLTLEAIAASLQ